MDASGRETALCEACVTKLNKLLPHLDKYFIMFDEHLKDSYATTLAQIISQLLSRKVIRENERFYEIFMAPGKFTDNPDLRVQHGGILYRWSMLREELEGM